MLCVTASNNILESANREEDMLCVTASFVMKRYAVFYCQPHCKEDISVFFYKCVNQTEYLQCQVPSRKGLYEWDMLAIKIQKKKGAWCNSLNRFIIHQLQIVCMFSNYNKKLTTGNRKHFCQQWPKELNHLRDFYSCIMWRLV